MCDVHQHKKKTIENVLDLSVLFSEPFLLTIEVILDSGLACEQKIELPT
jgi:hypothetical protein